MSVDSTTEEPVNQIARRYAVETLNGNPVTRLSEWNPHKEHWAIEVGIPGEATCTAIVPHDCPGLNNAARHEARTWRANPNVWKAAYAAWVAGDAPGAIPPVPSNATSFPVGPAFFNWDTRNFTVAQAKEHIADARSRGAEIIGCSQCNLTAIGEQCPACGNDGKQNGADPVAAFREMVESGGNAFVIGRNPGGIAVLNIGPMAGRSLADDEAANLAAWLIVVGGTADSSFAAKVADLVNTINKG